MKTIAKFISSDFFKEYNGIDDNTNNKIINACILKAQRNWLEDTISSSLYYDLMDKIDNNNLNTDETFLCREYIKPVVAEYGFYEFTLSNSFQTKAIGLVQPTESNSNNISMKDINTYRNSILNGAERTAERCINYLCENSNLYPKYNDINSLEDKVGNKSNYFSGMDMPKRKTNLKYYRDGKFY